MDKWRRDDWLPSEYEDFFNASFLEKLFLLRLRGIPSFIGYEKKIDKLLQDIPIRQDTE